MKFPYKEDAKQSVQKHFITLVVNIGLPMLAISSFILSQYLWRFGMFMMDVHTNLDSSHYSANFGFFAAFVCVFALFMDISIIMSFMAYAKSNDESMFKFKQLIDNASDPRFKTMCFTYVLVNIYTFLWSLIPIAGIFIGIYKSITYSQAIYIAYEKPETSISEIINESKSMMVGHIKDYIFLNLSFIGWFILNSLTCGVIGIYVTPYYGLTLVNYYHALKVGKV